MGLKVDCNKTKYMEVGTPWRRGRNDKIVLDEESDLEKMDILRVDGYKYLGSIVHVDWG